MSRETPCEMSACCERSPHIDFARAFRSAGARMATIRKEALHMRGLLIAPVLLFAVGLSAQVAASFGSASVFGASSQTNNPVSLVVEHKQVQTLADGTHISSITREYFYRDTLGRTRTEREVGLFSNTDQKMRSVSVSDPVAGVWLSWQTGTLQGMPREYTRIEAGHPVERPQLPPRVAGQPVRPESPVSPQSANRPTPQRKQEDLGTRDVQGMPCHATRHTTTFPVGFLGNDRPITSIDETCISPELGRSLEETHEDPRTGTRTVTVMSLTRGEPGPSLFLPPADYKERVQQVR